MLSSVYSIHRPCNIYKRKEQILLCGLRDWGCGHALPVGHAQPLATHNRWATHRGSGWSGADLQIGVINRKNTSPRGCLDHPHEGYLDDVLILWANTPAKSSLCSGSIRLYGLNGRSDGGAGHMAGGPHGRTLAWSKRVMASRGLRCNATPQCLDSAPCSAIQRNA